MFCDLVGSTALSARMDPEDLCEVISAYQKCVAETVQRFGGFVAKYMGDGVLVYFGYPQAHEDDAERAVRAGEVVGRRVQLASGKHAITARRPLPSNSLLWLLRSLHATGSLQCLPLLECGFDCLKISMLAVFGMLFDGDASPGKPTTGCRTNGVFGQNVCQRLGELAIKRRNVCAAIHDLPSAINQATSALEGIFRDFGGARRLVNSHRWSLLRISGLL